MMVFLNRVGELRVLSRDFDESGLAVIYGRRRVGKSTLIKHWIKQTAEANVEVYYSQAIEASLPMQISQICNDLSGLLPDSFQPKSWQEFFSVMSLVKTKHLLVLDEFPYLVKTAPELPSVLQNYIDNMQPKTQRIVLLGSSQSFVHSIFLSSSAPLYERASVLLRLLPMRYKYFCEYLGWDPRNKESFINFSMVGGVPKYWSFLKTSDPIENANFLYFEASSRLELEPDRLLKEEGVEGSVARSVLEAVGRGTSRSSQIASRLGIGQNTISKPIRLLMDCPILDRSVPFGESQRNQKKDLV